MSFYVYETNVEKQTTAQRLVQHMDANAKGYYAPIIAEKEGEIGMPEKVKLTREQADAIEEAKKWNQASNILKRIAKGKPTRNSIYTPLDKLDVSSLVIALF